MSGLPAGSYDRPPAAVEIRSQPDGTDRGRMTLVLLIVAAWLVLNVVVAAAFTSWGHRLDRRDGRLRTRAERTSASALRPVGH